MTKSTAVTKSKGQSLTATDESVFDTGRAEGLENVTARDLQIPRLTILQALSPQLTKNKQEYIKGASPGMFCDVGMGEVFGDQLHLLPVHYALVYLEWAPRGSGGGFVANHGTDRSILEKCKRSEDGRNVLPNGNYIADTATYYVLNLTAHGRRSFLPMASTQLRASRRWMTAITAQRLRRQDGSEFMPPIFYRSWLASIAEQSNQKGAWFGWKFDPGPTVLEIDPSGALLAEAKDFYEQAATGLVTGDVASAAAEEHAMDNNTQQTEDAF